MNFEKKSKTDNNLPIKPSIGGTPANDNRTKIKAVDKNLLLNKIFTSFNVLK